MSSTRFFLLFIVIGIFIFCFSAFAKAPSKTGKMEKSSGLQPVFPDKASCIEIASPYGSQTRYDGSLRPTYRFGGRHGGIDLSLPEGTPLLALAGGTVVNKGKGKQMEGIYLWVQHPPEDTGLSYWVYSKYQHLQSLPELSIGAKVIVGQEIALSGKTGTTGGHYPGGYPHLHLSTLKSPKGKFIIKDSRMLAPESSLMDPLLVYHENSPKPKDLVDSPPREKTVTIPYMTTSGHIWPQGTRVVWPVACQPM